MLDGQENEGADLLDETENLETPLSGPERIGMYVRTFVQVLQ